MITLELMDRWIIKFCRAYAHTHTGRQACTCSTLSDKTAILGYRREREREREPKRWCDDEIESKHEW